MNSRALNLMLGGLLASGGVVAVLLHQETATLRADNQMLRQQMVQLAAAKAENGRLAALLGRSNQGSLPEAEQRELLKLRGELGSLRQQTNELARIQAENLQLRSSSDTPPARTAPRLASDYLPRDSWAFAGYGDPDSALESCLWAWGKGDPKAVVATFTPAHRAGWGFKTDEEIAAQITRNMSRINGFRILDRKTVSADEVRLTLGDVEGKKKIGFCYKRVGNEWKFDHEFRVN